MRRIGEAIAVGTTMAIAVGGVAACSQETSSQKDCVNEAKVQPHNVQNNVTAIRGIAKVIALCYQRIDPAERHTDTSTGYTSTVVVTLKNSGRLVISEHASDGLRTKTSGTIADPNKATAVHIGVFADASLQTPLSGVELDAELSSSDQTPLRTFWVKTSYDQVNTAPNGAVTMLVPGQPDQRFVDATKADQIAGQTITQSAALLSVRGGDPAPQLPRPAFSH